MQIDFGGGDAVDFFKYGRAGLIRLVRPTALNSLSQTMIEAIARAFTAWDDDRDIAFVLIEGEGRAFCAGGDVVALWHELQKGGDGVDFFTAEYRLNSLIGHFSKPCLSFLDGFVMGGGAGLSMHGSHRIVTENTRFAMPEVAIGFFPDVGMGTLLARLDGYFGVYLAMTAASIQWGDCCQLGLATHAISAKIWPILRQRLLEGEDLSVLDEVSLSVAFETAADERALIAHCFSASGVSEIIERLKKQAQEGNDFAARTLALLQEHAPLSLRVIHKQMVLARDLTLDQCLQLDKRLAYHMVKKQDFREGVRARLIDKDNKPHWQPSQVIDVSTTLVDGCFSPHAGELDL